MLMRILKVFYSNIRTAVAAGTADAVRAGIKDGVAVATEALVLEAGPSGYAETELEIPSIDDFIIV